MHNTQLIILLAVIIDILLICALSCCFNRNNSIVNSEYKLRSRYILRNCLYNAAFIHPGLFRSTSGELNPPLTK